MKIALSWQQMTTVEVELDIDDGELCAWAIANLDLRFLGEDASEASLRRSTTVNSHLRRRLQQLYAIANATPRTSPATLGAPRDTLTEDVDH